MYVVVWLSGQHGSAVLRKLTLLQGSIISGYSCRDACPCAGLSVSECVDLIVSFCGGEVCVGGKGVSG